MCGEINSDGSSIRYHWVSIFESFNVVVSWILIGSIENINRAIDKLNYEKLIRLKRRNVQEFSNNEFWVLVDVYFWK